MADIEITDEASLEAWLKTRPRRDAEIIAFRAAVRVFPLWGRAMEEEWVETEAKLSSLPILRCLEISHVQVNSEEPTILAMHVAIGNAQLGTDKCVNLAEAHGDFGAASAANAATFSTDVEIAALASEIAITFGQFWEPEESWKQIILDFSNFDKNTSHLPLWPSAAPDWFTTADLETRAIWAKDPATWAFWEKWWDGVISGDMPFAPELLRDVALIEDDIWQAGPREVAAAIAKIEKIHELRADLAALTQAMENEDLPQVQRGATLSHRGHNNPPEMIEAIAIVQANAVDITQALDDAREELAKPAPEPSRLKAIGTWMLSALMKAAGYCGVLTDKFLQEFAGEMGKQAATVVAWIIKGGIGVSLLTAFAKSMIAIWPV